MWLQLMKIYREGLLRHSKQCIHSRKESPRLLLYSTMQTSGIYCSSSWKYEISEQPTILPYSTDSFSSNHTLVLFLLASDDNNFTLFCHSNPTNHDSPSSLFSQCFSFYRPTHWLHSIYIDDQHSNNDSSSSNSSNSPVRCRACSVLSSPCHHLSSIQYSRLSASCALHFSFIQSNLSQQLSPCQSLYSSNPAQEPTTQSSSRYDLFSQINLQAMWSSKWIVFELKFLDNLTHASFTLSIIIIILC